MGAYLSEPKTTKESSDSDGVFVSYGASSMQGWRISQEDAHNCILEFDKHTSLFAVYDGHGGHEVADYCSKYLPDFIKQTENYKKGDYVQALKDAFLGFDATLATPEVVEVLKSIMGVKEENKGNADQESASDDEEAIQSLVEEAHMPLDEVMAKYKAAGPMCRVLSENAKPPVSPMLRGRRGGPSSSSSSSAGCSSSGSGSSSSAPLEVTKEEAEVSSSSSSQVLCNGDSHVNGEVDDKTEAEAEAESSDIKKENAKLILESSEKCEKELKRTDLEPDSSGVGNGEADSHNVSSSSENGSPSANKKKVSPAEFYRNLLQGDSDSEEEDETFVANIESEDDSDEAGDDESGEKGEEDSSEEDDEEEDEEEDDDSDFMGMDVKEEPGSDSGCTAVVALLVGNQLLVANAGDSRCVVCREGKAVEMSVDHKPEDEPEKERIEGAGGKVTCDGRVNGGLNLSRALGDHAYKQTKLLPSTHQMITALPDIQTLTVDPQKDEFMVLACDGIWNSMTSQEVVDFVRIKLEQKTERLSQICEELFDHCLAPNTQGDGTGCDNMTCVIVKFKPSLSSVALERSAEEKEEVASSTLKRPAEDEEEGSATAAQEPCAKKSKVDADDS